MSAATPPSLHRPTFAAVDLGRLRANFRVMKSMVAPGALVCPMVKANAYGHGDIEVARELRKSGAIHLGVTLIEEGLRLRSSGDGQAILVFGGFLGVEGAEALIESNLTPVVCDWPQLEMLDRASQSFGREKLAIHLEFDTGMSRLGFAPADADRLRAWFEKRPMFRLEGVCTHLLRGDDLGVRDGESERQFAAFTQALRAFRGFDTKFAVHVLNSGGAAAAIGRRDEFEWPSEEFGPLGARPGIALYGSQPLRDPAGPLPLKPILSWKSRLILVKRLGKGDTVSYDATWRAQRESWIGVVPVGYADGFSRRFSNLGSVLCRGARAPVAGIVCMDYFMIDLTDIVGATGAVAPGEEIVLIGKQGQDEITAHEIASRIGTISYEILTGIGARVPRVYESSASESGGA